MVYIIYITAQLNSGNVMLYHLSVGILNHVICGALIMLGEGGGCNLLQLQIKVGTKILCTHRDTN